MLTDLAHTYSEIFAPELFVLLCGLLAIGYEWRGVSDGSLQGLGARVGVLGLGWTLAFAVYQGIPQLVGTLPEWGTDVTGSVGLGVGLLVIWLAWRLRGWGEVVQGYARLLLLVTVPHLLITPFWGISSHVIYTVVPAGYVSIIDRRFVPLALVPIGMVFARPLAGAHTWLESFGGLLLGAVFLLALSVRTAMDSDASGEKTLT